MNKSKIFWPLFFLLCISHTVLAAEMTTITNDISGYIKSFNVLRGTGGFSPELADNPLAVGEKKENFFNTLERIRLKVRTKVKFPANQRLLLKIDYDHQADFGSYVGSGDFRVAKTQVEKSQFIDTSQTLVEKNNVFYEHRLHRVSLAYQTKYGSVEVGRKQIPWGLGHFFTPTDLFNPFNPTQLELGERDGVDALHIKTARYKGFKGEFVATPRGKRLHPRRYLGKIARDLFGYEVGVLGGRVGKDHVMGFHFSGNIKDSAVRGEFLYREAEEEEDFVKFTVNADYNFPYNIYGLLEYHFNGQGFTNTGNYNRRALLQGEVQQLAKNYLALVLGRDLTSLIRLENRTIWNLDDNSFFLRPELQYEAFSNLLITTAAQLFLGSNEDEFGAPEHLYIAEVKYSF